MRNLRPLTASTLHAFRAVFQPRGPVGNAATPRFVQAIRQLSAKNTPKPNVSSFLRRRPSPAVTRLQTPTFRQLRFRRHNGSSTKPDATSNLGSPEPATLSFSQRLRKLSREYGWSALGVYLLLSALDFPFCFLAVRTLGTDRIGHWEHVAVQWFWNMVPRQFQTEGAAQNASVGDAGMPDGAIAKAEERGWGVEEADEANTASNASIWTQLALAYAIHKTFIFIRVPLTAAITPKVVKVLRGWGWDIGKRKAKVPSPGVKRE
ncbi:MAG: hypothetical protein M1832_003009 [Thelocarpon impressellum]|nr:MAG: hypothetical protein M1832_003009 [Thelocarpon impressellum]